MNWLKKFNTKSEYEDFKVVSGNYVTPNVSLIGENDVVYNKYEAYVGDIAYWDGSKVRTTSLSNYNASLGQAVGVVVVPGGFAPDGKTRIVSLHYVDVDGNALLSGNSAGLNWYLDSGASQILSNYKNVPHTDNTSLTGSGVAE